jgi:hypothetical protein
MRHRFASILSLLAASFAFGCNSANLSPTGSTVLNGPNAAIGGVNLQNSKQPSSITWDKHVTSCRYDPSKKELVFGGDGTDYLRASLDPQARRATLHGPSGALVYEGDACRVFKLDLTNKSGPFDGRISVVCSQENEDLTAAVRFERCEE